MRICFDVWIDDLLCVCLWSIKKEKCLDLLRYAPSPGGPLTHVPLPFMPHVLVIQCLITYSNQTFFQSLWLRAQSSRSVRSKTRRADQRWLFYFVHRKLFQETDLVAVVLAKPHGQERFSFSFQQFLPAHQIQFAHNAVALIPIITILGVRVCYRELNIPLCRKSFGVERKCCIKSLNSAPGLVIKGLGKNIC